MANIRKIPDWQELGIEEFITVRNPDNKSWSLAQITNTDETTSELLATRLDEISWQKGKIYRTRDTELEEVVSLEDILSVVKPLFKEQPYGYQLTDDIWSKLSGK